MDALLKKSLVVLSLLFSVNIVSVYSQTNEDYREQVKKQYEDFKKQANTQYSDFRDKANAEYAEFMRQSWETFQVKPGVPLPKSPDPVMPPIKKEPEKTPVDNPLPQGTVIPLPEMLPQAQPIEPIPVLPEQEMPSHISFKFFNIPCSVTWNENLLFHITSFDGENLAIVWKTLSESDYNAFLADCIDLRSKLVLCDWAYIELVQHITKEIFGSPKANEAVFLQMFVLSQTGYKVRLAQIENEQLVLLINTDYDIYAKNYFNINEDRFYLINSEATQLNVLNNGFPKEQSVSLRIDAEQFPSKTESTQKLFSSKAYPNISTRTGVNKELIDFYNAYPRCDWKIYAGTPLSETVKKNLYPVLQQAIEGKTEVEAANRLINFVQTAFQYQTDDEQFGYERPFFPDELFHYPYSDCEDRAILFSTIVRDLLKLDVVLLHYPNHLATAVRFNEDVKGDYVTVRGEKHLVCDPTYIGAAIGEAMPDFKTTAPEIVELQKNVK